MHRTAKDTTYRTAIVTLAPLVMLVSYVYHPFIARLSSPEAIAAAARTDLHRWGIAHLLVVAGGGLMALAFIAMRDFLRDRGEDRYSARALPFAVFGSTLYAVLPGLELGAMPGLHVGADFVRMQEVLEPWFMPILLSSALTNAVGLFLFALAFRANDVLAGASQTTVVTALVVMAVSRFFPLGLVQFHVQGVAGVVALWIVARAIRADAASAVAHHARPVTAV